MVVKRRLYQSKQPFDAYPFEAICCGSWQAVKKIRIDRGTITFHLVDDQYMILERGPFSDLRIRSRPATLYDCTCFLRPGVDISALLAPQHIENSDGQESQPVWVDAKINSIERRPHDVRCSCQFYVNFYVDKKPLGSEKGTLSKDTQVIGIDQILILQKLPRDSCEGEYYRWEFSEDCSILPKTKVLLGKFLSDLSWLVVTSVIKNIAFDVRSVKSKIVYGISDGDHDSISSSPEEYLNAVNFREDNGVLAPVIIPIRSLDAIEAGPANDEHDRETFPYSDIRNLRRSKRRHVQPDRYLGFENIDDSNVDDVPNMDELIEDELSLPLVSVVSTSASSSKEYIDEESKDIEHDHLLPWNTKQRAVKPALANSSGDENQLAIVPVPDGGELVEFGSQHLEAEDPGNCQNQINETSSRYYYICNTRKVRRKNDYELDDMNLESRWQGKPSFGKVQGAKFHSATPKAKGGRLCEERTYKKRSLSAGAYKDLINSFLKNLDTTIRREEPPIIEQWKKSKTTKPMDQKIEIELDPCEEEEESSGTEMLWREMELALASGYFDEENEGTSGGPCTEIAEESTEFCHHEYKLDEEIGILCRRCGFVITEIKDVAPPFMQHASWNAEETKLTENEHNLEDGEDLALFPNHASPGLPLSEEKENVWALIPELRRKLHFHQKRAFEFLWKNIAGSLVPGEMEPKSSKTGGCVISHSPGAGKTFLIIAFLVSYLKLFPGKRPLVLAPKTTLYTWYKEFIKWEVPVPVHLIHGRRTYRLFRTKLASTPGVPMPTDDVKHILDCLEKMQKWHTQPSVLVMGYTSFLTLMREDCKFAHRKYMARVLRESPGLLILDEGHNPRSTKSRLRKCLMKVETELRILLSGTLFQNNFCEYFNTLCLARPKFVIEVQRALDPRYERKKKAVEKARHLQEARARKLFLDNIARKIDSGEGEERVQGLNMLRNLTNEFIDVYEGGSGDNLPGLQLYTILMNSTEIQQAILKKLQQIMSNYHGYPLELELLITLGAIHPYLITSAICANKFFFPKELMEMSKCKFDVRKGSKVKFVLNLLYRVTRKEKVLIFCHNIAPIRLFLDLFEKVFRWRKGKEVLALTGDLELFERGKVMDRFEEPGGASRVLLASITACCEGISLTAASRVILLDSEWNPSKTKQAIARAFRPGQQKVVYVYQLLATGTLEEDKYRRTTWKEWVSNMIFSESFEDPSSWQTEKIEDDMLRELVEEDRVKSFHMIMKNEKASTVIRGKDETLSDRKP